MPCRNSEAAAAAPKASGAAGSSGAAVASTAAASASASPCSRAGAGWSEPRLPEAVSSEIEEIAPPHELGLPTWSGLGLGLGLGLG